MGEVGGRVVARRLGGGGAAGRGRARYTRRRTAAQRPRSTGACGTAAARGGRDPGGDARPRGQERLEHSLRLLLAAAGPPDPQLTTPPPPPNTHPPDHRAIPPDLPRHPAPAVWPAGLHAPLWLPHPAGAPAVGAAGAGAGGQVAHVGRRQPEAAPASWRASPCGRQQPTNPVACATSSAARPLRPPCSPSQPSASTLSPSPPPRLPPPAPPPP